MKYLLILSLAVMLIGCGYPPPMNDAESKAYAACLEKGWYPKFFANGSYREMECTRKK